MAIEARQTADHRLIVRKMPIPMQFHEIREDFIHVVHRVRPLGVAGDLGDLPRRELAVNVFRQLQAFLRELIDLFADVHRALAADVAQFVNLRLQLGNRLLKIQKYAFTQLLLLRWAGPSERPARLKFGNKSRLSVNLFLSFSTTQTVCIHSPRMHSFSLAQAGMDNRSP